MSCVLEPRHCGEVALQERAIIRGPKPYHPNGRMRHELPANAGLGQAMRAHSAIRGPGAARLDARPPTANRARSRTGATTADPGRSRRLPTGGSGYPPKSPCQTSHYSGLGRKKALQTGSFKTHRRSTAQRT
jgi:hypothetical protein